MGAKCTNELECDRVYHYGGEKSQKTECRDKEGVREEENDLGE